MNPDPSDFLNELETLKENISATAGLAVHLSVQGQVVYSPISHELDEAWDAVNRAVELLNEANASAM